MNRTTRTLAFAAAVVCTLALSACGGNPEGAKLAGDGEPTAAETTHYQQPGTRDNPFKPGDRIQLENWTVKFGETELDATEKVMAENMFNEEKRGYDMAMVEVEFTYDGKATAIAWIDLRFAFVTADGVTTDGSCGVVPHDLLETDELYTGGTATGNACVQVKEGQVEDGTWKVVDNFIDDTYAAFVSTR